MDDKTMVILTTLILGLAVIYAPALTPEKAEIIKMMATGLFGAAVGKTMTKGA